MATNKITPMRECNGHRTTLDCIGTKKETDFFTSWSLFSDGKVRYCKTCCDRIYQYYLAETQSEKSALYYTLQKIDIPCIKEVFEKIYDNAIKTQKSISISAYMTEFLKHTNNKDIWTDFNTSDMTLSDIQSNKIQSVEQKREDKLILQKRWGIQDTPEDYVFLEDTFDRYTDGVEFINSQQEDLYRDLCQNRLTLRKIQEGRINTEESIDKVSNRISSLMKTLKVDQFEGNKKKTLSEQLICEKIAMIEQTKPAELYKEPKKYKDFNKLDRYFKDIVLRPLLNTLVGHKDFDIDIEDVEKYNIEEED